MKEDIKVNEKEIEVLRDKTDRLFTEIKKAIYGQDTVVEEVIMTLLAGGHGLLEGVPGLAKTLMIKTLAACTGLSFNRIQFTPDLMPTDIIGTEIFEESKEGKHLFRFNKGPIFTNILLADEINRTPPKTQSALLEAMQEYAVTYSGNNYPIDRPFFILATQNPIEQAGTFPLPEAQLDRFMTYILLDYPEESDELEVLNRTTSNFKPELERVIDGEDILKTMHIIRDVVISPDLVSYTNRLIRATRPNQSSVSDIKQYAEWGAGTRAGQSLILMAKAMAFRRGSLSVKPEDLKKVAHPVLRHRILVNFKAEAEKINSDYLIDQILKEIQL